MKGLGIMLLMVGTLSTSAGAQNTLDVSTAPVWALNDTWTFRIGTTTRTHTVTGVREDGYTLTLKTSSGGTSNEHVGRDLVWGSLWRPKWPLTDGLLWTYSYSTSPTGSYGATRNDYTNTFKVLGVESVTVPAGTFQAVHIHGQQCITSAPKQPCGDFNAWYAPQVKWFIKNTFVGSLWSNVPQPQELISYELH